MVVNKIQKFNYFDFDLVIRQTNSNLENGAFHNSEKGMQSVLARMEGKVALDVSFEISLFCSLLASRSYIAFFLSRSIELTEISGVSRVYYSMLSLSSERD